MKIIGTKKADTLVGTDGADVIKASRGADVLIGANGADTMKGGQGRDTFIVSDGDHILDFQKGIDHVVVKTPVDNDLPWDGAYWFNGALYSDFAGGYNDGHPVGLIATIDGLEVPDTGDIIYI